MKALEFKWGLGGATMWWQLWQIQQAIFGLESRPASAWLQRHWQGWVAKACGLKLHWACLLKAKKQQVNRALKEIKRDLERALIGVDNAAVAGDASTAREMASISQQISTTVDAGSNSTDALTEAKLLELGEDCFNNGSDPSVLMIKPADAQIVAGFAASSGRNREFAQGKSLVNVIDLYVEVASVH